jgi:hypothetical protein
MTDFFDRLSSTGGVIMDPFLNLVAPLAEYPEKAALLLKYNEMWGTKYMCEIGEFHWNDEQCKTIVRESELCYNYAKAHLTTVKNKGIQGLKGVLGSQIEGNTNAVCRFVKRDHLPQAMKGIKELFPKLTWTSTIDQNNVEWLIWARATREQAMKVLKDVQPVSFTVAMSKVDQSTDLNVTLKNPNGCEMRIISVLQRILPVGVLRLVSSYTD